MGPGDAQVDPAQGRTHSFPQLVLQGQARNAGHFKQVTPSVEELPRIEFDYCFPSSKSGDKLTALNAVDVRTGSCCSVCCRAKGASDEYTVRSLQNFIDSLGWTAVRLRYDHEPCTRDVARAVKARHQHPRTLTETLVGSRGSLGKAENLHYAPAGQIRTMLLAIAKRYPHEKWTSEHTLIPWLVRHAGWLIAQVQPALAGSPSGSVRGAWWFHAQSLGALRLSHAVLR